VAAPLSGKGHINDNGSLQSSKYSGELVDEWKSSAALFGSAFLQSYCSEKTLLEK
jgi:hypothetical protein